jgi:hypothetical protein
METEASVLIRPLIATSCSRGWPQLSRDGCSAAVVASGGQRINAASIRGRTGIELRLKPMKGVAEKHVQNAVIETGERVRGPCSCRSLRKASLPATGKPSRNPRASAWHLISGRIPIERFAEIGEGPIGHYRPIRFFDFVEHLDDVRTTHFVNAQLANSRLHEAVERTFAADL